jgi:hypothetical protein
MISWNDVPSNVAAKTNKPQSTHHVKKKSLLEVEQTKSINCCCNIGHQDKESKE